MISDRIRIAHGVVLYAIADLCVCRINPADPWIAALRLGLITLFTSVCLYGVALLVGGICSKRTVNVCSFSPVIRNTIQFASILICALLMTYSLFTALPLFTDHHSVRDWRGLVGFQTQVIQKVEGHDIAEHFWRECANHLAFAGERFEQKHDFERALDYYSEYKKLGDAINFPHPIEDDVLGRICDRMRDFKTADFHYTYFNHSVDENCKTDTIVSHAQLLRLFDYVPEEVLLAEFPWAENVAAAKNASALEVGQVYELIPFSKLDDFQRQLLRPAFHSELLSKASGEGYAPELASTSFSPKQAYVIPLERRLLHQLRFSLNPIVTGDK
jgi:hypothetical protein